MAPQKRKLELDGSEVQLWDGSKKICTPRDLRPFVRSEIDAAPDQHLCARCRLIDFRSIFNINGNRLRSEGLPVFHLRLSPRMPQSQCSLCRMFAAMVFPPEENGLQSTRSSDVDEDFHLRAFPSRESWNMETETKQPPDTVSIVIGLSKDRSVKHKDELIRHGMIRPRSSTMSNGFKELFTKRSPSLQNYSKGQIRNRLEDCRQLHQKCSRMKMRFPQGARVIDCVSREITALTSKQEYLALSYVWGCSSTPLRENDTRPVCDSMDLPTVLPRTIEDAMEITMALGFQYLWIDRYCIKQYHSNDKEHQIKEMANIYSCSSATICALGPNDNAGIYSASQKQKTQLTARVQGTEYALTARPIPYFLRHSAWSHRGWTLQELVVSPRCLFFTDDGVVMTCCTCVFSESAVLNGLSFPVDKDYDRERMLFSGPTNNEYALWQRRYASGKESRKELLRYLTLRSEYLRRRLGYDTDALNAFQAILSQMETPSYWGVPGFWFSSAIYKPFDESTSIVERPFESPATVSQSTKSTPPNMPSTESPRPNLSITSLARKMSSTNLSSTESKSVEQVRIGFISQLCWSTENPSNGARRCPDELPSWSWLTQTSNVSDPLYRMVGTFNSAEYAAEVDIVRSNLEDRVELTEYFSQHGSRSIMPQQSRFLEIHSVVAHWDLVQPASEQRRPLARASWISNAKWLDGLIPAGELYFDSQLPLSASATDTAAAETGMDLPTSGYAVLMMITRDGLRWVWYWLAIRENEDSTSFHREGIWKWSLKGNLSGPREMASASGPVSVVPPEVSLQTVRLC